MISRSIRGPCAEKSPRKSTFQLTVSSQLCTAKASLCVKKVSFSQDLAVHSSHATEAPASVADDRHGLWRWRRRGTPKKSTGRPITNYFAAVKMLDGNLGSKNQHVLCHFDVRNPRNPSLDLPI